MKGDIQRFYHIHLYPQDNVNFHQYVLPEYKLLLAPKGKECFPDLSKVYLWYSFIMTNL